MQEMKGMPQIRRNYSQCIYMKKVLVFRKYEEFSQLKNKKANNLIVNEHKIWTDIWQ